MPTLNLSSATLEAGNCWLIIGTFGTPADTTANGTVSILKLFENGVAIGPAHATHADIANLGHGRFSHWSLVGGGSESIRLSSSDNTNPKTNGRTYTYTNSAAAPADVTAPALTITAPAAGATLSGTVAVTATASDAVSLAGVQFKVDGVNLGSEDAASPYSASWNTTTASQGPHIISAVARDATGNTSTVSMGVTVSNAAPPPPPPPPATVKTLFYGWLNERWVAATMANWANKGIGGFMIAGQIQWFTPSSDLETYNRASFTALNANGAPIGITDNFPVISLTAQNWANDAFLPAWSDSAGWSSLLSGGMTAIANFVKTTGCKGIVFDTENYSGYLMWNASDPRNGGMATDALKVLVYQRGQDLMNALQAAYPNIQIILIQEGALWASINDPNYELWPSFYKGMASVQQSTIVLGAESTYPEDPLLSTLYGNPAQFIADRKALLNNSMAQYSGNWSTQGSLAVGMRPLGVDYSNKGARYTPDVFKAQLAAAKSAADKYVWIYSHGSAWWQMTQAEVNQYSASPWHYTASDIGNTLPTISSLSTYFNVLNGTY